MKAILLAVIMAATSVAAAAQNPSAAYVQRTMKALEASTAEQPAHVQVLTLCNGAGNPALRKRIWHTGQAFGWKP